MGLNEHIDLMKEEIINSTVELVKIKSVEEPAKEGMPFGEGPHKALEKALEISKNLGFKVVNLDGYVGYAEYGQGEEYVAALGHLDVVPEGEGWKYGPYDATIAEGKIFGRGTSDDKGPTVAALYGLKAIMDENLSISKRIRIIFGLNEETGGADIEHYLTKEKPPVAAFTPDAEYPLINGEKGLTGFQLVRKFENLKNGKVIVEKIHGGQAGNIVADYCNLVLRCEDVNEIKKRIQEFATENSFEIEVSEEGDLLKVKCIGISAHASTPHMGLNAIMIAVKLAVSLEIPCDDMGAYLKFLDNKIGFNLHGEEFGCYLEDEVSGKLTFNVGIVDIDRESSNLRLDLRYPVTKVLDDMLVPFNKTLEGTGIEIAKFSHCEPLYFDAENELVKKLQKVYTDITNEEATLISIGGGTYAKSMPNTLAFGPEFPGDENTNIHKPNEFIKIDNLIKNAKIYAKALYELAK